MLANHEIVIQNKITFELDERNKTALVVGNDYASGDILIQKSIFHNDQHFIVTCLKEKSFKMTQTIRSINFPSDSKLKTIEKETFSESTIENIFIPSSVLELKKGWCIGITEFTQIIVMPNNQYFKNYDNKMIIGKSNSKSCEFDSIFFVTSKH